MAPQPRRQRRSIADRFRDFVHHEYPLDQIGDDRVNTLLDQLNDALSEHRETPK